MNEKNIKQPLLNLRLAELIVWFLAGFLVSWRSVIDFPFSFLQFYTEFLLGLFTALFPFLFRLIYGLYPFEYLRRVRQTREVKELVSKAVFRQTKESSRTNDSVSQDEEEIEITLLKEYLNESKEISKRMYDRSGIYLLIGCLIAFTGVLVFYFQSASLHRNYFSEIPFDFSRTIMEYLPRVGTLIFVEAIAFFFLKQYRITIGEYRYYESLKRQRENQIVILKIAREYSDKPDLANNLISKFTLNDCLGQSNLAEELKRSSQEQSMSNTQEKDLIDKLIEIMKIAKK